MNEAALPQSTVHIAQADPDGILLVIHAGAGNRGKKDTPMNETMLALPAETP